MKYTIPVILIAVLGLSCKKHQTLSDRCALEPNPGPCKAAITKYYYDKTEKKCKSFTWGGCDGVVPFETLEDCERGCGFN